MERVLLKLIKNDLLKKIVFVTGPRQAGKTTLSQMIFSDYDYLNYDYAEHRLALQEKSWDRNKNLLIFDELHKMKNWKSWLKGVYDVEGINPPIIVTGSARLDISRKMGDSLAGRYFTYHLHPFDIKEVKGKIDPDDAFNRLINVGGFPEPFLQNNIDFYNRWKRTHLDIILRQDLIDLESIRNIQSIETLIELLRTQVGSPVSTLKLARILGHDSKTIKRWLAILENLYIIFPVRPYHKNIARAILKEPKYYFYDTAQVKGDDSIKLENITACSLLKEINFLEDSKGMNISLHYLRNKDKKEIDFAVFIENNILLIEVKYGDNHLSPNFKIFNKYFKTCKKIQIVKNLNREKTYPDNIEIRNAVSWLGNLNLVKSGIRV